MTGLAMALVAVAGGCDRPSTPPHRASARGDFAPGWEVAAQPMPRIGSHSDAASAPMDSSGAGFGFESLGFDDAGWRQFVVTIRPGGSPAGVAEAKFTPLFSVDGKDPITYVTEAFFQANPGRRPTTIQPGDAFPLLVPPDTFVVHNAALRQDAIIRSAQVAEFVSDHGDQLRYYLTDPFPIRYEIASGTAPALWTVHLHPELSLLATAGRTNPVHLARLIYRVSDPDILQVEGARQLLENDAPRVIVVDRSQTHLDVARQFDQLAVATQRVPERGLGHLMRRIFPPDQGVPFMAVEDATEVDDAREGTVVRVEYRWDGSVRVIYRTGRDDTKGKRDPYRRRENERWAALYAAHGDDPETRPIKWGAGIPSDFPPFPSARDPWQQTDSYDFLVAGRYLVLTYLPMRYSNGQDSGPDVLGMVGAIRERYGREIGTLIGFVDGLRKS
jgi:hypothetical protein